MSKKRLLTLVCVLLVVTATFIGVSYFHLSGKIRDLITSSIQGCSKQNLKTYSYNKNDLKFQFCYPDTWSVTEDRLTHQGASLEFCKSSNNGCFRLQTLSASLNTLKNGEGVFKPGIFPTNVDYSKVNKTNKDLILENTDSQVTILSKGSPNDQGYEFAVYWYGQDPTKKDSTYEILYNFDGNDDPAFVLDMSRTVSIIGDSLLENR